jgi:hypothetical protein
MGNNFLFFRGGNSMSTGNLSANWHIAVEILLEKHTIPTKRHEIIAWGS